MLYGSFLRNNKHYSPSSTQALNSSAVHEALHFDNPVLDQFLVESEEEYNSSYLSELITGSILDVGDPRDGKIRGVAASSGNSNLSFSGSFQRFVRLSEPSQVFYDTLLQDPFGIAAVDGADFFQGTNNRNYAVVNLHMTSLSLCLSASEALQPGGYTYAFSSRWADSFPFSRYPNVKRLVTNNLRFGQQKPAVYRLPAPQIRNAQPASLANVFTYLAVQRESTPRPRHYIDLSLSPITPSYLQTAITEFKTAEPTLPLPFAILNNQGLDVITIENMAKVRQATYNEGKTAIIADTGAGKVDWGQFPPRPDIINSQRTFAAAMIGYGNQNGKYLDIPNFDSVKSLQFERVKPNQANPNTAIIAGQCEFGHPAGFKYGYMNSDHLSPSMIFRGDRYGQLRDTLEQRLFSKTYSYGDEYNQRGELEPAVTCIFVDADESPISDSTKTQCLNLSTAMTSSRPFIEGEVLREIIFSSESVTIT